MALTQVADLGSQYVDYTRDQDSYRPLAGKTYTPGLAVVLAALDAQLFPDGKCVTFGGTGGNIQSLIGIVAETWNGFDDNGNYTSPASFAGTRGTLGVPVVRLGFHPGVLLDCSGTGAVTVVDKLSLIASRGTAGYVQGGSASAPAGGTAVVANAVLPASGIGSSITAAALAQAAQIDTLTGTPAVGDILQVTIQSPYIDSAPGVVQTITYSTPPLTTAQAATVTTAATALAAYLNTVPSFTKYFVATSSSGVVTVTVIANAPTFHVNGGSGSQLYWAMDITLSGMVANSLTFAAATVAGGGTISTAGSTVLASGTGFKGYIPARVCAK